MPVRSSLCTYSPMMAASSGGGGAMPTGRGSSASSKYSSILPTTSSLSYGHYKPLSSASSVLSSSSSSPSASATSGTSTLGRYSRLGGASSSSSSSYSPIHGSSYLPSSPSTSSFASSTSSSTTASTSSTGSPNGLYKPLSSMRASPASRFASSSSVGRAPSPRYSSSSSTGSLTSTSSVGNEHTGYQPYKSAHVGSSSSSSAYSSGSSLSSTTSDHHSSPYSSLRQSRRLSSSAATGVSSSSPAASSSALPVGAPAGLMNMGNTCYMNASLQALYSLDPFRDLLLSQATSGRHSDKILTNEVGELFKLMRESSREQQQQQRGGVGAGGHAKPISPADFKFAFSRHQSKFAGFGQQDAQEFLRYLIDGIHEECNAAAKRPRRRPSRCPTTGPRSASEAWTQYREIVDDSPLVDLLVGQLCSTITCCECRHKSHCWDPFWDLSLPLIVRGGGGGTGRAYHRPYTSASSSSSSNSSASSSSVASRYSTNPSAAASRLADVIDEFTAQEVLEADERPMCGQCKRPTKSTKQISLARLPKVLILHLKKFTNDGYKLSQPEIQIDKRLTFNGTSHYQLKACISHHGHSSSSGHYTSHCEYASRWLHFDDGRVRDVTSSFDCSRLDDAYVLFYTQKQSGSLESISSDEFFSTTSCCSISQSKL